MTETSGTAASRAEADAITLLEGMNFVAVYGEDGRVKHFMARDLYEEAVAEGRLLPTVRRQ